MMLRPALICLAALVSLSSSEYVWTGTEWEWQDPDPAGASLPGAGGSSSVTLGGGSSVSEGSGDGNTWDDDYDDEDYDDNYTYDDDYEEPVKKKEDKKKFSFSDNKSISDNNKKDKKKNKNKNNNNRNRNSEILPATDDEDLFEGSGASDFDLPRSNYPESNNNNFNNPMTPVDPYNTNDNSNVYVDENDDSYDDEYDYDDEDYDDDISFGSDNNNNYGNNYAESTPKPMDPVINMNNNNVWNTPQTTERSFTPRVTTTTSKPADHGGAGTDVHKTVPVSRPASFFAQPGILAAVIGGAVVGLLCAILLVMFIVYRMRKKDEGSYALDEPKRSHNVNSYSKPPNREFYA